MLFIFLPMMIPALNITGKTGKDASKNVEMPLINCEINFILTLDKICVFTLDSIEAPVPTFAITETKPDVPVVTLSTKGNAKVLEQLNSGFKSSNNWDKYQSKKPIERQNQSLD